MIFITTLLLLYYYFAVLLLLYYYFTTTFCRFITIILIPIAYCLYITLISVRNVCRNFSVTLGQSIFLILSNASVMRGIGCVTVILAYPSADSPNPLPGVTTMPISSIFSVKAIDVIPVSNQM